MNSPAERVVKEEDGCEGTKTIEVYAEPKIEMKLNQKGLLKRKNQSFLNEKLSFLMKTVRL